jgi:hypothetical protein
MARGRCTFRQRDLTAALKAAASAGAEHVRAEIEPDTGKIIIVVSKTTDAEKAKNEWDEI